MKTLSSKSLEKVIGGLNFSDFKEKMINVENGDSLQTISQEQADAISTFTSSFYSTSMGLILGMGDGTYYLVK